MNYTLNFAHLCDFASLSAGKLNVLGIFKNINSSSFPYIHPQMYVVTNIHFIEPGQYIEEICISSGGTIITSRKETISVQGPVDLGIIAQLNNTVFETPGDYSVEVLISDEVIKKIPFTIFEIK